MNILRIVNQNSFVLPLSYYLLECVKGLTQQIDFYRYM